MCLYVPCCDIRYDFCIKRCLVRLYLCIVVPNTYWGVFFVYFLVYYLCLVYHMLLVSLDCLFLITPSVFSNVYLNYQILNNKHSEIKEYAHVHLNDMYCLYLNIS